jgi:hypothetical protein
LFLSLEDICDRIIQAPAPILFIDTCIFLDVLRTPFRDNISSDGIATALKLIELTENTPPNVWLVTNETVRGEWHDNVSLVKLELEKEIKKVEARREKLLLSAKLALGQNYEYGQKETLINLHSHLESLSRNFLDKCLIAKVEDTHSVKAMQRVRKCMPPARKGKQEAKDCEILEAFLDISKRVCNAGYDEPICFISSNSDDYGKPEESPIQNEFDKVNAKYVNSLQWGLAIAEGRA